MEATTILHSALHNFSSFFRNLNSCLNSSTYSARLDVDTTPRSSGISFKDPCEVILSPIFRTQFYRHFFHKEYAIVVMTNIIFSTAK